MNASVEKRFLLFFSFVWARWWYLACVCVCACVHVRRWTHSIHAKNGWLFFFSLPDVAAICSGNSSVSATMTVALLKSPFLFYGLRYRAYSLFFSLCLFDLCFVSVLSFRLWLEVFLFCFHGAPHSLCVTSPLLFSFDCRFSFLFCFFVCCCCFWFFLYAPSQRCFIVRYWSFGFFFSFNNSLLRTRK